MAIISLPPKLGPGSRRSEKCRTALGPAFQELANCAAGAGWHDAEIALALADIADAHVEALAKELDIRTWEARQTKQKAVAKFSELEQPELPGSVSYAASTTAQPHG